MVSLDEEGYQIGGLIATVTMETLLEVIRNGRQVTDDFIVINDEKVSPDATLGGLYESNKDDDGLLYLLYVWEL